MTAFLEKYRTLLLAGVAVLLAATFVAGRIEDAHTIALNNAVVVLRREQDNLRIVLRDNAKRDKAVAALTAAGDSAARRADRAEKGAAAIKAQIPALTAALEASHGDTLTTAERALYGAMTARADSLDAALIATKAEVVDLTKTRDSLFVSLHSLTHAATQLDTAATVVIKKIPIPFFVRIAPKTGFGIAAGVDQNGKPAIVAGVTLSWPR